MPSFNLWVKNPYPFQWEEMQAIEEALRETYGSPNVIYYVDFPVHRVAVDRLTLTRIKQVALTLLVLHRQARAKDKRYGLAMPDEPIEVEITEMYAARPTWVNVRTT